MDAEQIWRQAQDENTSPEILAKLAKSKEKEILRCVAGNPNTPVATLKTLGVEFPDAIVENPIFDLLLLENPESKFVLLSLARASTTSVEKLRELANHRDRDIREAVVINRKTSRDIIDNIFENDSSIKESVAKNPQTSESLLCSLAKDNNYYVLYAITQRKCLSEKIIMILIHCNCSAKKFYPNHRPENYSWRIRQELAKNLSIQKGIINYLLEDEHHHVRAAIAEREDISEEQAMMLAHDISDLVREKLADNPKVSNAVKRLLNILNKRRQSSTYINQVKNTKLTIEKIKELSINAVEEQRINRAAKDYYHYSRLVLANIPSTSINSIHKLIKNSFSDLLPDLLLGLTLNINTPPKILKKLAANTNYQIRQGVAEHPKVTVEILDKLKTDKNISVREKVAQSAKISIELIEYLAKDSVPLVRRAIAAKNITPANILDKLKSDRSLTVRLAVAENPNTSIDTLQELLKDEVPKIVESATNSLKKRSL